MCYTVNAVSKNVPKRTDPSGWATNKFAAQNGNGKSRLLYFLCRLAIADNVTVSWHCIHANDTRVSFGQSAHRTFPTKSHPKCRYMRKWSRWILHPFAPFGALFCWRRSTWMLFEGETMNELMVGRFSAGLLSARSHIANIVPVEFRNSMLNVFVCAMRYAAERQRKNEWETCTMRMPIPMDISGSSPY